MTFELAPQQPVGFFMDATGQGGSWVCVCSCSYHYVFYYGRLKACLGRAPEDGGGDGSTLTAFSWAQLCSACQYGWGRVAIIVVPCFHNSAKSGYDGCDSLCILHVVWVQELGGTSGTGSCSAAYRKNKALRQEMSQMCQISCSLRCKTDQWESHFRGLVASIVLVRQNSNA